MAKARPQAGGFTFFYSLVTKTQMSPLSPPDLQLGHDFKASIIWCLMDIVKPRREEAAWDLI